MAAAIPSPSAAAIASAQGSPTPNIVAAANAFLSSLNDTQRGQAAFEFSNTTAKAQWSNFPYPAFQWIGVRMGDLTSGQQQLVHNLLLAALSQKGYDRVMASMNADQQLRQAIPSDPAQYGTDYYFVSVFGTPSTTSPWMFRFGGHHITVNVSIVGDNLALTPSFPGCQPCDYTLNGQDVRPSRDQQDKAFALVHALDATQQEQAVLSAQPIDLVLGPAQPMQTIAPEGILGSALNPDQQGLLLDLVRAYVGILNDASAAARMAEIQSNLASTYFAWYGPTTNGGVAYYRVQGPTVWIEFAPQTSPTPRGATPAPTGAANADGLNHVHSIYRDPTNEYGAKWTGS